MQWPDIFFKARKLRREAKPSQSELATPKNTPTEIRPPTIKPVPAVLASQPVPVVVSKKSAPPEDDSTRTLPAMHGIVLRPPVWPTVPAKESSDQAAPATPSAIPTPAPALAESKSKPTPSSEPIKNVEELMAEADPVRAISQTSAIRLLKRASPETDATNGTASAPTNPAPAKSEPVPATPSAPPAETATAPKPPPPPAAPAKTLMPFGSIFRRKAKMTELARIVLPPPKHEDSPAAHAPAPTGPTVVPAAFPVASMTARAGQSTPQNQEKTTKASVPVPVESAAQEKPSDKPSALTPEAGKPAIPETTPAPAPTPAADAKPVAAMSLSPDAPKVEPEAPKPAPTPAAPAPSTALSTPTPVPEKREFHLANGEHVAGTVLSETPEAVYIDHGALGVITIPRAQIAKRLIEIILVNGDRIVGDIMAETADTLYVRHASLGMLTVPRAQRSTRVVEAILKDGDRILGEVLTETDAFTVIRSATLGTVTIPHGKISMLNRKIEQIELKALPPPAPEIKDKPAN